VNPIIKNILAVLAGIVVGSVVNMGFISVGLHMIPAPPGADASTMEGLKASMHLYEPKHFLFPFLAHAFGTLAGAAAAAAIAASHKLVFAMAIGMLFLLGGLTVVLMTPSPLWFTLLDLGVAYLPMAWLGWKLVARKT
jgi:hypothetical protein